jgi:cellulose synthase/poly-beta-1,6-N-acetylglucosamine synthase-like glycosyltransferase
MKNQDSLSWNGCQLSWWGRAGKCSHLIFHVPLQVAKSTVAFAIAWRRPAAALASDFLLLLLIFYFYYSFSTPTTHLLLLLLIHSSYYSFTTPSTHFILLLLVYYSYGSFIAPTACVHNLLLKESTRSRSDLRFRGGLEHSLYNTGAESEGITRANSIG